MYMYAVSMLVLSLKLHVLNGEDQKKRKSNIQTLLVGNGMHLDHMKSLCLT